MFYRHFNKKNKRVRYCKRHLEKESPEDLLGAKPGDWRWQGRPARPALREQQAAWGPPPHGVPPLLALADEGLWDILIKDIPKEVTSYTFSMDILKPGVSYDFRVIAVNDYGFGTPSSPSQSVPGTGLGARGDEAGRWGRRTGSRALETWRWGPKCTVRSVPQSSEPWARA